MMLTNQSGSVSSEAPNKKSANGPSSKEGAIGECRAEHQRPEEDCPSETKLEGTLVHRSVTQPIVKHDEVPKYQIGVPNNKVENLMAEPQPGRPTSQEKAQSTRSGNRVCTKWFFKSLAYARKLFFPTTTSGDLGGKHAAYYDKNLDRLSFNEEPRSVEAVMVDLGEEENCPYYDKRLRRWIFPDDPDYFTAMLDHLGMGNHTCNGKKPFRSIVNYGPGSTEATEVNLGRDNHAYHDGSLGHWILPCEPVHAAVTYLVVGDNETHHDGPLGRWIFPEVECEFGERSVGAPRPLPKHNAPGTTLSSGNKNDPLAALMAPPRWTSVSRAAATKERNRGVMTNTTATRECRSGAMTSSPK